MRTKIEFMRGRREDTPVADRMTYPSRCKRFKLEKHVCLLTGRTRWYALHKWDERLRNFWHMIVHMRTYRTKNAAIRAMEKFRKVLDNEPVKKKARKRSPARKRV